MSEFQGRSPVLWKMLLSLLLSGLLVPVIAQNSYSEQTVAFGEDEFFPYTRGRILKVIEGERITQMERIFEAIMSWDSINPPKGFEIRFSAREKYAELTFSAYVREGDSKTTRSGAALSLYINDPARVLGSPLADNIFLQPEIVDDFLGYPVYRNTNNEVTVISKSGIPLFVPVNREEYLLQLIKAETGKQDKKGGSQQKSDSDLILAEMEKSYRDILKVDPATAAELRIEIQKFRADMAKNQDADAPVGMLASLKAELAKLSPAERKQPALYAVGAFEKYGNFSGLVPESDKEAGTALVRPAPIYSSLANNKNANNILILSWNVGSDNANSGRPRLFDGEPKGFQLADYYMARLYHHQKVWSNIISLVLL